MYAPVWTCRQRMGFPRADPTVHYSLPLFLHRADAEAFWLAGGDSRALRCCRDPVYEAVDHGLFWLDQPPHQSVFLYCKPEPSLFSRREGGSRAAEEREAQLRPAVLEPEEVLPLGEFFRGGAEAVLERWDLRAFGPEAAERVSTRPLQPASEEEEDALGLPGCGPVGERLDLDTSRGFVGLARNVEADRLDPHGSITVRVHFFDDGVEHPALGHWLGFKSWYGTASVGLAFGIDGCYSVLCGQVPSGKTGEHFGWMRTFVDRSRGWHMFEVQLEAGQAHFSIDGEPVHSSQAEGAEVPEEVALVSRCGGHGLWAGLEVFHTPRGQQTWELGIQRLQPGDRLPWKVLTETGRWQVDDEGVMQNVSFLEGAVAEVTIIRQQLIDSFDTVPEKYQFFSEMDCMLGKQFRVVTVNSDGMVGLPAPEGSEEPVWWFPPVATALVVARELAPAPQAEAPAPAEEAEVEREGPAADEAPAQEEPEEPEEPASPPASPRPPGVGGLSIEAWTIPGEEDLARMERVMTTFVNALEAANVAMPGNIHRIERCRASQHASCFVYSFGTRRMHVATRASENGRLLLVVRCGGGFLDFVEFARRHGSLERLRVERANNLQQGRGVVRLTSVLSRGRVQAIQSRGAVPGERSPGSRRPSLRPSSRQNSSRGSRSPSARRREGA
mmetsp:Transcript_38179/g.110247  ORF Transcript_38179/g.110247 Transcript_38179/m.110247 type:complete len:670 (-) Transcript_38179:27-2036(-)